MNEIENRPNRFSDHGLNSVNYLNQTVKARHQRSIYETYSFVPPRQVV
jgi:hypothetical protein